MATADRRSTVHTRPGGRSARVVAAVLGATLAELGRVGYGRLRVDDVAARSGVNKTTIYRRWPDKADLVCAALKTVGGPPEVPDTGHVRSDLIASFKAAMRGWATERGLGLALVLTVERTDPTVDRLSRSLRERYRVARRAILDRAVARGELPETTDRDLLLDVLTGAVLTRVRQRPGPLDDAWLARVVDFTLAGAGARQLSSTTAFKRARSADSAARTGPSTSAAGRPSRSAAVPAPRTRTREPTPAR
jgi:AcrR family transcriptional regulator